MKKVFLIILPISLYIVSCVFESPITYYRFKIENQTNQIIIINYKSIKDTYEKSDTIQPKKIFEKELEQYGCYKDYKDSLILKFFTKLSIQNDIKQTILRDPFQSKNWDKKLIKKLKAYTCKDAGGIFLNTFIISPDDFNY